MMEQSALNYSSNSSSRGNGGGRTRQSTPLMWGSIALLCFAATGTAVAWRTDYAQKVLRVLWEGDKEGRARARQLRVSVYFSHPAAARCWLAVVWLIPECSGRRGTAKPGATVL